MINCIKAIHPRCCAKDELLLDVSRESNNISILHKDNDFSTYVWHILIKIYKCNKYWTEYSKIWI